MRADHPVRDAYLGLTEYQLCHRQPLEFALAQPAVDYEAELEWWTKVLDLGRREDFRQVMQEVAGVPFRDPPEGTSWTRWAESVTIRLEELARDPSSTAAVPLHTEQWQLRDGTLDASAGDLVRRAFGKFVLPPSLTRRSYVVVDVGAPVGSVTSWNRAGGHTEERSHRVGVVVETTDRPRVIGMHAADPREDDRAGEWRDRWPVLADAFGGWFSLGALTNGWPATMQYSMLERESDELLERLAAEGAELLLLGDEDLHAAVRALGCYVEPSFLRLWLGWMFWRIGYFDWK